MGRGLKRTSKGRCIRCLQAVAWRELDGYKLFNAAQANGEYVLVSGKFTPGSERHNCGAETKIETDPIQTAIENDAATTVYTDARAIDLDAIVARASAGVRSEIISILQGLGIKQETVLQVRNGDDTLGTVSGAKHPKLAEVIRYVVAGKPVYLYGPAGSGKTYGAVQAAEACGREAIVGTMPGSTVGKILGFVDASGKEVITPFMRAFTEGCVYVADEFDRIIPSAGAALNSALANRRYTVGTKTVEAHKDFAFIGTGNTDMRGATRSYTAAQPLDLATAARFAFVEWEYDEEHETAIVVATGLPHSHVTSLLTWGRTLRSCLSRDRVDTVWSGPREMLEIAHALLAGHPLRNAINSWVWRGFPQDSITRYERECPPPRIS